MGLPLLAVLVAGCGTPTKRVDPDQDDAVGGTGVDSADVRATADTMCRELLGKPEIFAKGTPYVEVKPPENRTRFQLDTTLVADRMQGLLTSYANGRMRFVARGQQETSDILKEREAKRSGAVSTPTEPSGKPDLAAAPLGVSYFLRGRLEAISKTNGKAVSDYIQATFMLVDAETSEIVWQSQYDWKKVGKTGVIYR